MINCENIEMIFKKYKVKFEKKKLWVGEELFQFGYEYFFLYEFEIE